MTKMFTTPDGRRMKTWSPIYGCEHQCYHGGCWAKRMALRLKAMGQQKYQFGFEPRFAFDKYTLRGRKFKEGDFVFCSSMGDAFGEWVPSVAINEMLAIIKENPQTTFLLQTKNPDRFHDINIRLPHGCYLGTTIETNRFYPVYASITPEPGKRYSALMNMPHDGYKRFISIEPIMDFDLDIMLKWMGKLKPDIIEIGADSLNNHLPEPSWDKVEALLKGLRDICPVVIEKEGLERLKHEY